MGYKLIYKYTLNLYLLKRKYIKSGRIILITEIIALFLHQK